MPRYWGVNFLVISISFFSKRLLTLCMTLWCDYITSFHPENVMLFIRIMLNVCFIARHTKIFLCIYIRHICISTTYVNIHTDSRKMRILIIRITITIGMSLYQHISVVTYQCETSIHLFCYYYHHQNMTIYMKPFYFYNWSMIRTFIIKGVWVPSTEEPRFAYVLMYVQIWQKGNYKAKFMCMMKW